MIFEYFVFSTVTYKIYLVGRTLYIQNGGIHELFWQRDVFVYNISKPDVKCKIYKQKIHLFSTFVFQVFIGWNTWHLQENYNKRYVD